MTALLNSLPTQPTTVQRSPRDAKVLAQCLELDLTLVKNDVMTKLGWPNSKIERVERLYKRYLYLCYKHRGTIVPCSSIDEFWEMHMLDSKQYSKDSMNALGFFLHHDPHFLHRNPCASRESLLARFDETKRLFAVEFGEDISDAVMGPCEDCIPDYDPPTDPEPAPDGS